MKIKRYFAADMRRALNLARQEHGPDVVILDNRHQSVFDEAQLEQDFGKYAVYNPIGTHRGH